MKVKVESEKVGLKLNIQKMKTWHPVPSLHGKQMGKQWKQWQTIFLGSKIPADGDCSHGIKRRLLLGRKVITNLDSILRSRDITLSTKVHLVKAMVFPVVMYGCERGQWQPTPVLLPGKSHGWRSLAGCSAWGHQESDTTEQLHFHFHFQEICIFLLNVFKNFKVDSFSLFILEYQLKLCYTSPYCPTDH